MGALPPPNTHTHMCTLTHVPTRMHTHTHANSHVPMHAHTHTRACMPARTLGTLLALTKDQSTTSLDLISERASEEKEQDKALSTEHRATNPRPEQRGSRDCVWSLLRSSGPCDPAMQPSDMSHEEARTTET